MAIYILTYILTTGYSRSIQINELDLDTTWMNHIDIMLSEKKQDSKGNI